MGDAVVKFRTDYGQFRRVNGLLVAFREDTWASGVHTATKLVQTVVQNPATDLRAAVGAFGR